MGRSDLRDLESRTRDRRRSSVVASPAPKPKPRTESRLRPPRPPGSPLTYPPGFCARVRFARGSASPASRSGAWRAAANSRPRFRSARAAWDGSSPTSMIGSRIGAHAPRHRAAASAVEMASRCCCPSRGRSDRPDLAAGPDRNRAEGERRRWVLNPCSTVGPRRRHP